MCNAAFIVRPAYASRRPFAACRLMTRVENGVATPFQGVANMSHRTVAPMADSWELAKRVIIWYAEPPPPEPGPPADPAIILLPRIAHALRADEGAEVDRLCRHAMRSAPDAFIPAVFLAGRLLNRRDGVDEAESLILGCGVQEDPERRACPLRGDGASSAARRSVMPPKRWPRWRTSTTTRSSAWSRCG